LISFCQRPDLNPSQAGTDFGPVVADMMRLPFVREQSQIHFHPSNEPVCWAIINSSLVGMTQAETLLPAFEIRGPLAAFAFSSRSTPSQAQASLTRWRISAEFSPIPAVNTSASIPQSTAAKAPISLAARK